MCMFLLFKAHHSAYLSKDMVTNSLVFLFFSSLMILMTSQLEGGKVQDSSLYFSQWQKHNCFSFETSDLLPLPQRGQTLTANRTARNLLACGSLIQEWSRNSPCHVSSNPSVSSFVTCDHHPNSQTVSSQLARTIYSSLSVCEHASVKATRLRWDRAWLC